MDAYSFIVAPIGIDELVPPAIMSPWVSVGHAY
jgi:hypothetical protein